MRDEGSFLADSPMSLARFQNIAAFNQLRLWFANIDYQWSKWVLGFNNKQQQDLLRKLFGELSTQKLSFIGIGRGTVYCRSTRVVYVCPIETTTA